MRVEFALDVFERDAPMPLIVKLLECVADRRHDWSADRRALVAAERYFGIHAPTMASTYLELGRKGLVDAAWRSPNTTTLVRITLSNLANVAEDLCRPAVLIVEDLHSDGCFVRAVAKVFRADHLLNALANGWLVIRHGGGDRLAIVAETDRRVFCREVRIVALLDSDRLRPQERTRAHEKADDLRKSGILVHVLELREAENYVPNRVLSVAIDRSKDSRRKLEYVKRLTSAQRGHYDMKIGFRRKDSTFVIHREQQGLFGDLDGEIVRALADGFGRDLLVILERRCDSLTEEDFSKLGPGVVAELRELLSMISRVV